MSRSSKRERLPREFACARELITAPVNAAAEAVGLIPLPIKPFVPDMHTAQRPWTVSCWESLTNTGGKPH